MIAIGIAAWCLSEKGPDSLAQVAKVGLNHAQVDFGFPGASNYLGHPEEIQVLCRASADSGVAIIGLGVRALNDVGMTRSHESEAARRIDEICSSAVEATALLGARLVFFPSFRASAIMDAEGLQRTAGVLKRACQLAAPHRLQVCSENGLDVAGNQRLVDAVDEPNFRILLDSYNPVIFGHRPVDLLEKLGDRVARQIHIKDGQGGKVGDARLGKGDGEVLETLAAVRLSGAADFLILENDYRNDVRSRVARDCVVIDHLFRSGSSA
jgi:sugar phosphate isomerase/epimerase